MDNGLDRKDILTSNLTGHTGSTDERVEDLDDDDEVSQSSWLIQNSWLAGITHCHLLELLIFLQTMSCHVDVHHLDHHHPTVLIVLKVTLDPMMTRWHTEILLATWWQFPLSSARLVSTDWLELAELAWPSTAISWHCYVSTTSWLAGETPALLWLAGDQDGKQAALHRQYDVLWLSGQHRPGSVVKWELLLWTLCDDDNHDHGPM